MSPRIVQQRQTSQAGGQASAARAGQTGRIAGCGRSRSEPLEGRGSPGHAPQDAPSSLAYRFQRRERPPKGSGKSCRDHLGGNEVCLSVFPSANRPAVPLSFRDRPLTWLLSLLCSVPRGIGVGSGAEPVPSAGTELHSIMNEYGDTMQEVAPHSFAIRVLGPYMLGQCFNLVLYAPSHPISPGTLLTLTHPTLSYGLSLSFFLHYRQTLAYRNDSAWLRRLILLVVGLNSYQAVINLLQILFWGTTQDRSTVDLWGLTPVDCMAPMGLGVIGVIVQGWLAKRAVGLIRGRLGRHLLTAVFVLGMLAFSIGSVLFSIMSWLYYSGAQVQNLPLTYNKSLAFMLISGAFTDCLISASLFYALGKRYTGFATATDGVVHKVIRTGLETAAYTAVAAVIGGERRPSLRTFRSSSARAFSCSVPYLWRQLALRGHVHGRPSPLG